ncbi:ubiquitin-conjugating enzyme E2 T-like isoform X1 [Terrapene carolina triunguis]|uniref:ubiquitin-conjugating enzyme E2 T isoform X1 n=1 Tax=Terrapene triunguis TaxID=2587831 RepID=UPI000CEF8D5E|nr:ubiquitin-conjugating enzyme E2 T isoform X1 [Terrapene carolina triunguis]XP_024073715.1 ubiquitin-conjugating enzyme E2 T isoform X1 [Terrapene carolina triunguis]XP_026502817.1 ubiquitin-conjugating enzyme E2 T-like isoform X1 [Terrapene carolina triunguis]XP_026502818.1 ubiquitin-conjugating enzyme E2 T-like isoform X1 [Terrapene carolina triunguis]
MQRTSRLKRELHLLTTEPPPGIMFWQNKNRMDDLRAQILGGTNTPYDKGVFNLEVVVPERYPFEPPKIRFLTPIYHPNIDSAGRICLDVLRLPPKGAWRPSLNISTLLTSIQLLMSEPNPDDPLMADISSEYKYNKEVFIRNAKQWTEKHASQQKRSEELESSRVAEGNIGVEGTSWIIKSSPCYHRQPHQITWIINLSNSVLTLVRLFTPLLLLGGCSRTHFSDG